MHISIHGQQLNLGSFNNILTESYILELLLNFLEQHALYPIKMDLQVGEDVASTAIIQLRDPDPLVPYQQLKEVYLFYVCIMNS